jgi:hypothetical protein
MKLLLGLVGAASACASVEHVSVTPLPPEPSVQQRMWAYETFHPAGKGEELITVCNRNGCNTTRHPFVQFANGPMVRDPEDLAPLVAPDSKTLSEAHRATRADSRASWWGLGMVIGIAGGFIVSADGNSRGNDTELEVGLGVALGSLLVGAAGAYIERDTVYTARASAFSWYPHDLAEKLHVCWNGAAVVPCESIAPGAPPEQPRDPNIDQLRPR